MLPLSLPLRGRRSSSVVAAVGSICVVVIAEDASAATARSLGQPISSYSASLYGKTNLTARQTQTLTADPEVPLFGATSVDYDPAVVSVTGFGYGPAYIRSFATPKEFQSGASVELAFPISFDGGASTNGGAMTTDMVDLGLYLEGAYPDGTETGYLQLFYELNEVGEPGKYIPDGETFLGTNAAIPGGVDTHYFTFEYNDGIPNSVPASYRVYDDFGTRASGNRTDFMASGTFDNPDITEPGTVVDAVISGTIPEPGTCILAVFPAGALALRRRRKPARSTDCAVHSRCCRPSA